MTKDPSCYPQPVADHVQMQFWCSISRQDTKYPSPILDYVNQKSPIICHISDQYFT